MGNFNCRQRGRIIVVEHSIPANPLIAESLYLARYIEKAGSGTQRMMELCREAGLPTPDLAIRAGFFVLTLWRDWLTDDWVAHLKLNDRQLKAIGHIEVHGRITSAEYQQVTGAIPRTAARDLRDLTAKDILVMVGRTGRSAHYVLGHKQDRNGTNENISRDGTTTRQTR